MHADWATFPPKEAQETQARQARGGGGKLANPSCYDRYTGEETEGEQRGAGGSALSRGPSLGGAGADRPVRDTFLLGADDVALGQHPVGCRRHALPSPEVFLRSAPVGQIAILDALAVFRLSDSGQSRSGSVVSAPLAFLSDWHRSPLDPIRTGLERVPGMPGRLFLDLEARGKPRRRGIGRAGLRAFGLLRGP